MAAPSRFTLSDLQFFAEHIFLANGFSPEDGNLSARFLCRADSRGIDSHGIARLAGYVRLIEKGRLNPKPQFSWFSKFPTQATLNADAAIGFVAGNQAMNRAMEMAEQFGVGMVAVKNSNHFGIAGQYSLMAAERNLVGMAFTNASPLVSPVHSKDRMLGTNPIAVSIPARKNKPFVLDMATTTAANGKLEILQRKNLEAPAGWIQDAGGEISTDPNALSKGGSLLPLGSFPETGSHKGYGLGALVDIFSGVFSGANFGPWVPPFVSFMDPLKNRVGEGIGHLFIVFSLEGFGDKSQILDRMDIWMESIRNSASKDGQNVLVPGDPEWLMEEERARLGVPLLQPVIENLQELAVQFNIQFPMPL